MLKVLVAGKRVRVFEDSGGADPSVVYSGPGDTKELQRASVVQWRQFCLLGAQATLAVKFIHDKHILHRVHPWAKSAFLCSLYTATDVSVQAQADTAGFKACQLLPHKERASTLSDDGSVTVNPYTYPSCAIWRPIGASRLGQSSFRCPMNISPHEGL